jgi:hypothetical protein
LLNLTYDLFDSPGRFFRCLRPCSGINRQKLCGCAGADRRLHFAGKPVPKADTRQFRRPGEIISHYRYHFSLRN